jgi:hypothetical protein
MNNSEKTELLWPKERIALILTDDADEVKKLEAQLGVTQHGAVTDLIERSCWAEDFPQFADGKGTPEERRNAIISLYRVEESKTRERERNSFNQQYHEQPEEYIERLARYADKAMVAFRAAAGETLYPSALMHSLLHWCDHNGFHVPSCFIHAKWDYAGDKDPEWHLAEWDERTWHTDPDVEVLYGNKGFSATKDHTGVVILAVWDKDVMEHTRTVIDQYQAQKLADWLNSWIREQRKSMKPSLGEKIMAMFRRKRGRPNV